MNKDEKVRRLMAKAHESLRVAAELLAEEHTDFCASRAYYAMFYAAEAALLDRDLTFSKHSAVMARFGLEYAKTGDLDPKHLKALQSGFAAHNQGDYGLLPVPKEEATHLLAQAQALVADVQVYLEHKGYPLAGG